MSFICNRHLCISGLLVIIYISSTQSADLMMRRFHHPQSLLIITILNSSQLGSDVPQHHKATVKEKRDNDLQQILIGVNQAY